MTDPDCGFVFGATGARYVTLARRAARNLRLVMPDAAIDLYADQPVSDTVFDQVHALDRVSFRPKMEALRRARFHRAVYLDCDVMAVADVSDMFEILTRFDLTGVHENRRNGNVARIKLPGTPPNAFPQFNSGVLGVRKSPATQAFLANWENAVHDGGSKRDQPHLRQFLWMSDLRLHVMPLEYNLMSTNLMLAMGPGMTAPRLLHRPRLHEAARLPGDPTQPFNLEEAVPPAVAQMLTKLLATDRSLGGTARIEDVWVVDRPRRSMFGRVLNWVRSAVSRRSGNDRKKAPPTLSNDGNARSNIQPTDFID